MLVHDVDKLARREILIARPLHSRAEELSSLRKFSGLSDLKDIIGGYGCYLKKCSSTGLVGRQLYKITEHLANRRDLSDILVAAVPIRCFISSSKDTEKDRFGSLRIVERCLETHTPIFVIAQSDCLLYQVWRCQNDSKIGFQCPETHNAPKFECKANKSKFCKFFTDKAGETALGELLDTFQEFTGSASFPVFEFSAFINYCISAHYFQDWGIYRNFETIDNLNKSNIARSAVEAKLGSLSEDRVMELFSQLFGGKQ